MRTHAALALAWLCATGLTGVSQSGQPQPASSFAWNLPKGIPLPAVPADNPMSDAKVALGRRLFYDRRLSGSGTFACATCHDQRKAFTDGRAQAIGAAG